MTTNKRKSGKKLPAKKLEYELLRLFLRKPQKRLNAKQLLKSLKINNTRASVDDALSKLEQKGKITHIKDDKYKLADGFAFKSGDTERSKEVYEGFVDKIRSGAAYIVCDNLDQDIYVSAKKLGTAMDGDKVAVQLSKRYGKRQEGVVVKVLERSTNQFIGTFHQDRNFGFVVPDNQLTPFDVYVHPNQQGEAVDGDKVLVTVQQWPEKNQKSPVGKIEKIMDPDDEHEIMMQSILINHGFSMDFSKAVELEASNLNHKISDEEIRSRRDFRGVSTCTIDPKTAKDFDDALSVEILENGNIEIGIHIADVTHYIKPGSALDREAIKRSTSVYLVDRVAPMLPEILSNELCSLRPNEDSLTFSAVFEFDKNNTIVNRWFGKSIIHSQKRFAYEEAQDIIDGSNGPFKKELSTLNRLAKHLRKKRYQEGSIAFDSPEIQFELDDNNHPVAITLKERLETHLLVEDFMLLANREVAFYIAKKSTLEIPMVYRIHDLPDEQKLADYSQFLKEFGFNFDYQSPQQIRLSFARLSKGAKDDPVLAFAEPLAVRTMAKAVYSTENIGHFGLSFDYYVHFTSPIRRYADVLVHRILEKNLIQETRMNKGDLEQLCKHISSQERKAQVAERESIKFKQVEFIADHIGETFDGVISGMIDRGLFVALLGTQVEGMVSFDKFREPFQVEENRMSAVGAHTKKVFKIGSKIRVRVIRARIENMEVDMEVVNEASETRQ